MQNWCRHRASRSDPKLALSATTRVHAAVLSPLPPPRRIAFPQPLLLLIYLLHQTVTKETMDRKGETECCHTPLLPHFPPGSCGGVLGGRCLIPFLLRTTGDDPTTFTQVLAGSTPAQSPGWDHSTPRCGGRCKGWPRDPREAHEGSIEWKLFCKLALGFCMSFCGYMKSTGQSCANSLYRCWSPPLICTGTFNIKKTLLYMFLDT